MILNGLSLQVYELSKWTYQKLSKNITAVAPHEKVCECGHLSHPAVTAEEKERAKRTPMIREPAWEREEALGQSKKSGQWSKKDS